MATAISLVSIVIKTRALGAEAFGMFAVFLAYAGTMEILGAFRPWRGLIKFGAEARQRKNPVEFMSYVKMSFVLDMLGALLGVGLALAGVYAFSRWQGWGPEAMWMLTVMSLGIMFRLTGTPIGVLRLLDRFKLFTVQRVLEAVVGLLGSILVFWMGYGLWGFVAVTVFTSFVSGILLLGSTVYVLKQDGYWSNWSAAKMADWKPFFRFSGWTYLSSTLVVPMRHLDVVIVSAALSLEEAGIYRIVKQVAGLLEQLADPVYQAVYPQFATIIASGDLKGSMKYALKVGGIIALVILPVGSILMGTSFWWLGAVFGAGFAAGLFALNLFLLVKMLFVPTLPVHPLFVAAGYVRQNVWILAGSSAVYLALAWPLAHWMGLTGMVLAWLVQAFMAVAFKSILLVKAGTLVSVARNENRLGEA